MSTFKDARTLLLESYLDGVIDDDEFILLYDETSKNPELHMNLFFIIICKNDIKIQEYGSNIVNSFGATSMLLMSVSIPLAFFFFFQFASQFSRNLVQVFSDLFPFLSSRNCALFVSVKGSENMISRLIISS